MSRRFVLGVLSAGMGLISLGSLVAVQAQLVQAQLVQAQLVQAQSFPARSFVTAQATPPYNCLTREVWSPEKKAWCAQSGTPQNPVTLPAKPAAQQPWYNCLTKEVWTADKQAWCNALNQVQNATYQIPDIGTVKLTNGRYENRDKQVLVTLVNQPGLVVFHDMTGNGKKDAAMVLVANTGGSGNFVFLGAAWNDNGTFKPVTPIALGDRVKVNSIQASQGRVQLDMITHSLTDPACCPTQPVRKSFALLMQPALVQIER